MGDDDDMAGVAQFGHDVIASIAAPLGPRSEYVANYVGDRIKGWVRTSTHGSPEGMSKPGLPSKQHLETWERMANEEADKRKLNDVIVAPRTDSATE
jgi:hypothetical protein